MFRKIATTAAAVALGGTALVLSSGTAAAEPVAGCPPDKGELVTVEDVQLAQSQGLIVLRGNLDDRNGDGYLCALPRPDRDCILIVCPTMQVTIVDNNVPLRE